MIKILAVFEEGGNEKDCGERDVLTSYEAIMQEIEEQPADTKCAIELHAQDDYYVDTSAYRTAVGWEIHISADDNAETHFVHRA